MYRLKVPGQPKNHESPKSLQQEMTSNAVWCNNFIIIDRDVTIESAPDKGRNDTTDDAAFSAVTNLEKLDPVPDILFVK